MGDAESYTETARLFAVDLDETIARIEQALSNRP